MKTAAHHHADSAHVNRGNNPAHGHMGHDHHRMMIENFKKRFWISLIITIPVLVLSEMIQKFLGFHLSFTGDKYILFILSTAIFFYGGWPFLKGLLDEVKKSNPGMMTLIGMAISVAYLYSSAIIF